MRKSIVTIISCILHMESFVYGAISPGFKDCKSYFVNEKLPSNFPSEGGADICQRYLGLEYFVTRYSKIHKIPMYSAYTLDMSLTSGNHHKPKWDVDLALSDKGEDMAEQGNSWDKNEKSKQAMNEDYDVAKFVKGHLNPNIYHDGDAWRATFTLTNAVPQYTMFNSGPWEAMEEVSKNLMLNDCYTEKDTGTAYFITGAIPSEEKMSGKVTIPSWMFTAACCQKDKSKDSFSFGYIGENKFADSTDNNIKDILPIEVHDIVELGKIVKERWTEEPKPEADIVFFDGSCNYKNTDALEDLKKRAEKSVSVI